MAIQQEPRTLVHVVHSFAVGGLENGVVNLINRMDRTRWRHAIVALDTASETFCRRIERSDVEIIALRKPPGHPYRLYPRVVRLFRRLRPAVMHTRNLAALEMTLPALLAGVPARIHGEHGWDVSNVDGRNSRHRLVRRAFRPFVHRWVALSRHIADYLSTSVGVPRGRIAQIYNGVDTQRFRPAADGLRVPLAGSPFADPSLWILGSVGRMQAVKDPLNLLRAFALARQQSLQARAAMRLVMVGDGPQAAEVRAAVNQLGVGNAVWLAGERADVAEMLRGFDAFALPSLAEGISNTILESMASGLPVVATHVGGNPELLTDGSTGRLVPAADPAALAGALLDCFTDRAAARRLGEAARQDVERRFSLDRMVADYSTLYEQALAAAGAHAGGARLQEQ